MKIYSSSYENYLKEEKKAPLHNKLTKIYDKFPDNLRDLPNLILFGPKPSDFTTNGLYDTFCHSPRVSYYLGCSVYLRFSETLTP